LGADKFWFYRHREHGGHGEKTDLMDMIEKSILKSIRFILFIL